jgi:hypothetical protein
VVPHPMVQGFSPCVVSGWQNPYQVSPPQLRPGDFPAEIDEAVRRSPAWVHEGSQDTYTNTQVLG